MAGRNSVIAPAVHGALDWQYEMSHFDSHLAFKHYSQAVVNRRRFVPDSSIRSFLNGVRETLGDREEEIPIGKCVFRAQIGSESHYEENSDGECVIDETVPLSPKRMIPDPEFVGDGRVNPKGIAYFYASSTLETAIAEVRPWVAADVSVGIFELQNNLRVVNCAVGHDELNLFFGVPSKDRWDEIVWNDIDRAFARPVTPSDATMSYVPTQILAELFLEQGFDGVLYKSTLGGGHNIAIFDPAAVQLRECTLFGVESVTYETKQWSNPYIVKPATNSDSQKPGGPEN